MIDPEAKALAERFWRALPATPLEVGFFYGLGSRESPLDAKEAEFALETVWRLEKQQLCPGGRAAGLESGEIGGDMANQVLGDILDPPWAEEGEEA